MAGHALRADCGLENAIGLLKLLNTLSLFAQCIEQTQLKRRRDIARAIEG
jgi:hypothetical protein